MPMENKVYRIAQFGAFDVKSYGDVLFPQALQENLRKRINCKIDLFASHAKDQLFGGEQPVYGFDDFQQRDLRIHYDAIVIGGGELLHFKPILFSNEEKQLNPGELWLKPMMYAKDRSIPCFVYCCGVPYDLSTEQEEVLSENAGVGTHFSVRDQFSYWRLKKVEFPQARVQLVADPLLDIEKLYSKERLDQCFSLLAQQNAHIRTQKYIVAQYGTTKDIHEMANQLQRIEELTALPIILLPINQCHEDEVAATGIRRTSNNSLEQIAIPLEPLEIMSIIANAAFFIGTSLHGCLTAASYQVPFVGIDMYPGFVSKMDGLFTMLGCEQYLAPEAKSLTATFRRRMQDTAVEQLIGTAIESGQKRLQCYYDEVAATIRGE